MDPYASWRNEIERKLAAGQEDLESELEEGAVLIEDAAGRLRASDRAVVSEAVRAMRAPGPVAERAAAATAPAVAEALARSTERHERRRSPTYEVDVDRERARVGAWYELFPRSFGGFAGVEEQLPRLAELGFDVVYLPPIHPIGVTHRKGRNNSPVAEPGDPGSPWAIGGEAGGHTAVDPDLGTLAEFESLVMAARENDLEIALDFAIQCSPDHPWLRDHPDWFHRRPDGTLKYAENPPKRYQDIYNLNFDSPDWRGLWQALREALMFWVERGVSIFRVDNPHTKPTAFWEWLIADVREDYPDTVFLAEAFTSQARMYALAKAGFSQSYTYFTWKNSRAELIDYVTELAGPVSEFFRPNFFVNTPDILHAYLQDGGRPAFEARLVLAATLSPSYGIYSGFENLEGTAVAAGSEEYLDSEKYEVKDAGAGRAPAAAGEAPERDPARLGAPAAHRRALPRHGQRGADRLCQGPRRRGHHRLREPRPARRPRGPRDPSQRPRPAGRLHRPRPGERRGVPVGRGRELRAPGSGGGPDARAAGGPVSPSGRPARPRTPAPKGGGDGASPVAGIEQDIALLAARDHHEPHRVLGAHIVPGGVAIRAWRPDAKAVRALPGGRGAGDARARRLRPLRRAARRRHDGAALRDRGGVRGRPHRARARPLLVPADGGRAGSAPGGRGPPRGAVAAAGRAPARDRRGRRHVLRRSGRRRRAR